MSQKSVEINDSIVKIIKLDTLPLENIAAVLNENLKKSFQKAEVEVVDCPDLTQLPFTLACKGLGGKQKIIDVGGVPYLLPRPIKEKLYNMKDIAKAIKLDPCYILGAGAGPWPYANTNCEMMANLEIKEGKVNNQTRIAKVDPTTGKCKLEILPNTECRHAVLSNLYCSQGEPGKVLKILCQKRIGKDDFAASIRKILEENFKDKFIGLGGAFVVKNGKVKQHVMPDFSKSDIHSNEDLNQWLKFFEMNAPLIALGTLVNKDPELDLRVQHFHSFSHHGEGGHYHIDTTPDDVEYLAYFGIADELYRIDQPTFTHTYGRD